MDVQVHLHPDGVQLVAIVDSQTGQVYCQLPPAEVVRFLDAALARSRQREEGDNGGH